VAVAAHPFRKIRPVDEQVIRDGLCHVVECLNGRNTLWENLAVNRWQQRYQLTECGGSDAHRADEVGMITTRFFRPVRTRLELIQALKQGRCQPEIHAVGMPSAYLEMLPSASFCQHPAISQP
jgi:hypothetical protein